MEDHKRLATEGLPPIDKNVTVGQLLDRWHNVIVATRRETSAINYRYVIDKHLVGFVLRGEAVGLR